MRWRAAVRSPASPSSTRNCGIFITRERWAAFWRYFIAAGLAAVIDIGSFQLLIRVLPSLAAAIIAFSVAAVFNYTASSLLVFRTGLSLRRFVTFYTYALVGMAVNVSITVALLRYGTALPWLAKLGGVGVAFLFNFVVNYAFVFAKWQAKPAD